MSTLKKILVMILIGLVIYLIIKPQKFSIISNLYNLFSYNKIEKFNISNLETKEEESILLASPTLNPLEIKQLVNMKNTLIKPFTNTGTHPDTNQYHSISELDFKNLQAYLASLLNNVTNEGINFKIILENITPNIYCAITTNQIFLTPVEIKGSLYINQQLFGKINLVFMLKGSTNSLYVPKEGVFFNNKKYEMYIDNITIVSVKKDNSPEHKQRGFYATADNIDMMVKNNQNIDYNKTPQEIKIERKQDNPLRTFKELEDSEEDINLSEIIRENEEPEPENINSSIEINY